jgi:PilZ domain-containing protein
MSATLTDRRNATRVSLRIPLKYKLMGNQSAGEQIGESENVSQRGLFMWTVYPLEIGMQLELKLRMPSEISGSLASEVHCTARVVRIQESDSGRLVGAGLRIERYHATAERERWAN